MLNRNHCRNPFRHALVVVTLLACAFARAEIRYTVAPDMGKNVLRITMSIPAKGSETELQIPRWSPGAYMLSDFFKNISEFAATDEHGAALKVDKPNDTTWRMTNAGAKTVQVSYNVPATPQAGAIHYSGPSTYLYVVGRKEEPCRLVIELPKEPAGMRIAVGLDEAKGQPNTYTAPNYDVLADNPVTLGDFLMDTYTVLGKPHYIVLRGAARDQVNREYLTKACKHISESQADFFGGLPYNQYVWHFSVFPGRDGGGGLEHLSSTQISLAASVGPRSVAVMSHEFFHLWNVKRIRSKPLGPFDYQQLPRTGALWWLEGVTDYYADLLLFRYGWTKEADFLNSVLNQTRSLRSNPARLEVSPDESSRKVGDANNGRGNSNGWKVSYYTLGWLVGLCLDTEIRYQTKGKHSLDDVTRALWELCKNNKPGFEEDEIRKQCIRFGGEALGPFYDQVVMRALELPIEKQLAKMGLQMSSKEETFADVGFRYQSGFRSAGGGPRVVAVSTPAEGKLQENDTILAVNETSLEGKPGPEARDLLNTLLDKAQVGTPIKLKVRRGEETLEVEITPAQGKRTIPIINEAPDATDAQRALRKGWYYAGKQPKTIVSEE